MSNSESQSSRSVGWPWLAGAAGVSFGVLALVVLWVGPSELWQRLSSLSLTPLVVAAGAYVVVHGIRTARIGVLLEQARSSAGLSVVAAHSFANQILPARSGELTFPALLHKLFGSPVGAGATYLVVIRFAELAALFAWYTVALIGWLMLEANAGADQVILLAGILAATGLGIFALSRRLLLWFVALLERMLNADVAPDWRWLGFLRESIPDAREALSEVTGGQWRAIVGWSLAMWAVMFVVFGSCLAAAGIDLGIWTTVIGAAGGIAGNLFAFAGFGSIGTMEAGWTAGYVAVGAEAAPVAAAGFALHGIVIAGSALLAVVGFVADGIGRGHWGESTKKRDESSIAG